MYQLKKWFQDLYDDFGGKNIPNPDNIDNVIKNTEKTFGAKLIKYIGSGDNGIAFLASDGDIIKYTIDKNEAILWLKLKNDKIPGIAKLKDIIHITDKNGDGHVYAMKVEYVSNDLTQYQSKLIRTAMNIVHERIDKTGDLSRSERINRRTNLIIEVFNKIADKLNEFKFVPYMIERIAKKHNSYVYDIKPDNFKVNDDGYVILIDPSIPDIFGDSEKPRGIIYEDKILLVTSTKCVMF